MKLGNLVNQDVTLKFVDGPVIQSTVTDVSEGGIWIRIRQGIWIKLLPNDAYPVSKHDLQPAKQLLRLPETPASEQRHDWNPYSVRIRSAMNSSGVALE